MSPTSTTIPNAGALTDKLRENPAKWIVVTIMVVVALLTLVFTRQAIRPIDDRVTEFACSSYGDDLARPLLSHQRSNRFGLANRTYASCSFGPVDPDALAELPVEYDDDGEPLPRPESPFDDAEPMALAVSDFEPIGLYGLVKGMGIVLQLGVASLAVRLVGEPLLERFARKSS